ncbi:ribonuclease H-like domain-containing protein [Anaerolentibacter hominis]|uniref:ribonuclease H-like domain-containing protein n=1 Tax=Anaerolentibacter hominis TaxID=3079009 RepID=UPI0031B817AD
MKTVRKKLQLDCRPVFPKPYPLEQFLFFDIETTGFSPDVSSVYLIGCLSFDGKDWEFIQWFADDYRSEQELLKSFGEYMKQYACLVHYNGTGFDLPYIQKKWIKYKLAYTFDTIDSLDIYKRIYPYRKLLPLENLKLKTVETFLGIRRNDPFSGGDLIPLYGEYLKLKYSSRPEAEELFSPLSLHNEEDVTGMPAVCGLESYAGILEGAADPADAWKEQERFYIRLTCAAPFPVPLQIKSSHFQLAMAYREAVLTVPLVSDTLNFYFPNYKDYYYLPAEDTAIHKSVGEYVEKSHREQAKASNCYIKKAGLFLPQYGTFQTPELKRGRKDKLSYFPWEDSLLSDSSFLAGYARHLLEHIKE